MPKRVTRFALIGAMIISMVALAAFIFWTLDFHLSQSQTNAQHTLSTSTVSEPDQNILAEGLLIGMVDTGIKTLDATLTQEVISQFQSQLPTMKVTQGNEINGYPILWIEVSQHDIHWMPLRSTAELAVEIIYASDGDLSWRNATGTVMNGHQPAVHSRGTLKLSDRTQGLVSRKAYQRHLGAQVAAEIYRIMQQPLFDPPG